MDGGIEEVDDEQSFVNGAQHRYSRVYPSTQGSAQHRATHGATSIEICKTPVQSNHRIQRARNIRAT